MKEKALISVVIPVYNGERYLAEAIESVFAQEYRPLEIIAVNDGSTDRTEKILQSCMNVRNVSQCKQGASAARNNGIRYSGGEFLAFLDADDLWMKDKLKKQMALFDDQPDLDMVFSHVEQFFSPELAESLKDKIALTHGSMPGYIPSAFLIKKKSFLRVGLFDTAVRIGEFIDWYLKAMDSGLKSAVIPHVLVKRRVHDANTGIRERDYRKDYLRVLKASLDRRREKERQTDQSADL